MMKSDRTGKQVAFSGRSTFNVEDNFSVLHLLEE
jgi:hypothetical protein